MTKDEILVNVKKFLENKEIPDDLKSWSLVLSEEGKYAYIRSDNISVSDFLIPVIYHLQNIDDSIARERAIEYVLDYIINSTMEGLVQDADGVLCLYPSGDHEEVLN